MTTAVITGIGGQQQAAIAGAFVAAGWSVVGTSRTPRAGVLAADIETGAGLVEAFRGADVAVLTVPQDHRPGAMERIARTVARAAGEADLRRLVLNAAGRIERGSPLAVFAALAAAADGVLAGPVPAVVLEPTSYMDNLLAPWSLPGILAGTFAYPAPADAPLAWLSHRSLAAAAVAAATKDVAGRSIRIGGPEALTGRRVADVLAAHLDRTIVYAAIPLADFAAGLNAAYGAPAGDRIAEFYWHLADHADAYASGAEGMAELGVKPESFADFAARQRWSLAA
jgi:uncharacterized protein YbjT (DUF2867 family)